MHRALIAATLLALPACSGPGPGNVARAPAYEPLAVTDTYCQEYGFLEGTTAFQQCVYGYPAGFDYMTDLPQSP